jgi:hypothetical protein
MAMCGLDGPGIEQRIRERFPAKPILVRPAIHH